MYSDFASVCCFENEHRPPTLAYWVGGRKKNYFILIHLWAEKKNFYSFNAKRFFFFFCKNVDFIYAGHAMDCMCRWKFAGKSTLLWVYWALNFFKKKKKTEKSNNLANPPKLKKRKNQCWVKFNCIFNVYLFYKELGKCEENVQCEKVFPL
jgi:hypothetical protein